MGVRSVRCVCGGGGCVGIMVTFTPCVGMVPVIAPTQGQSEATPTTRCYSHENTTHHGQQANLWSDNGHIHTLCGHGTSHCPHTRAV